MADANTPSSDTVTENIKAQDGPENALNTPARNGAASRNGMNHPSFEELSANKATSKTVKFGAAQPTPTTAPDAPETAETKPDDAPTTQEAAAEATAAPDATTPEGRAKIGADTKLGEGAPRGLSGGGTAAETPAVAANDSGSVTNAAHDHTADAAKPGQVAANDSGSVTNTAAEDTK